MATKAAPITGEVLEWAVRDAGLKVSEVADRVDVAEADLRGWFYEDEAPTERQLRVLAKVLSRPVSFFFLQEPPDRRPASAQFRRFAGSTGRPGSETLDGVRLAQRVQKTQEWVRQRLGADRVTFPALDLDSSVEESAARLRTWLLWDTNTQTGRDATDARAAKAFRAVLQAKGVIALNLTLDEGVTRGFSLFQPLAPLVAANTRDPHRARLFSYAHELVHLALGGDAVCTSRGAHRGAERFCNQVAAALLMPRSEMLALKTRRFGNEKVATTKQVAAFSNEFKVSLRAAAIRLEHLGQGQSGLYDVVDREAKTDQKRRGGRYEPGNERTRPVIRVDQYGHQFINSLFNAEEHGLLRRRQVAELLRVSESELATVRQLSKQISDS